MAVSLDKVTDYSDYGFTYHFQTLAPIRVSTGWWVAISMLR